MFSRSVGDGALLMGIMETGGAGAADVWRRGAPPGAPTPSSSAGSFRFGVPGPEFLEWTGAGEGWPVGCLV